MIIYDKQLKLLTLSGVFGTINDGQHWSKQIQLDPELMGGNFWNAKVAMTAGGWGGAGYCLTGFGYITAGTTNGSTGVTTHNRFDDTANTSTARAALTTGRWFVCPSQLNGFGYVIGGTTATPQTRVEIYNDSTNTWTRRADISTGRYKSASFDLNGYAYVCNGQTTAMSGAMVNTVERYTDSINSWTTKNNVSVTKEGPAGMSLNGFGYSTCGNNSNTYTSDYAKVEKYNDSLDSWSTTQATATIGDGRTLHSAWGLNGLGYITFGHRFDTGNDIASHEEYNDASDNFVQRLASSTIRNAPQFYVLNNHGMAIHGAAGIFGTAAAVGNGSNQQYRNFSWYKVTGHFKHSYNDPLRVLIGTNISGRAISLPVQTRSVSANTSTYKTMVSNTDSALALGQTLTSNFTESVSGWRTWEIQVGVPQYFAGVGAFIWVQRGNATNAHSDPASFSINGYGYAAGGFAASTVLSITDQYNDFTDTWSSKATLTTARRSMAGISLNGLGYAVNGMTVAASGNTNIVEQYNDVDYWTTKARTTTAVKNASCGFTLNGFGWVSNGTTNALEQYNDSTDVWTSKTAGGTQRTYCAPFALNGYAYQACGGTTTEVNQYNDAADTWATKSACGTTTKDGVGGFQLNGNGYVAGGIHTGTYNNETLLYNDGSDIWYQRPTCGTARQIMNYYMLNGYGYVGLGLTTGGTESTEMWKLIKNDSFPILTVTARIEDNTPPS